MPGKYTAVTSLAQFEELINSHEKVVVDFWASWCGPCRAIAPVFESLADQHSDILFLKVDNDANQDIAQKCGISALPTFQFYKGGQKVNEFRGANPTALTDAIRAL